MEMLFWLLWLLLASAVSSFVLPSTTSKTFSVSSTFLRSDAGEKPAPPKRKKPKQFTIADLRKQMMEDPKQFLPKGSSSKARRTRKRAENPQQQYSYAAQRKKRIQQSDATDSESGADEPILDEFSPLVQARQMGLVNAANQHSDALVDDVEPLIVGKLRVAEEAGSGAYAYIIDKPAGWSILGGTGGGKKKSQGIQEPAKHIPKRSTKQRVKITRPDGRDEFLEFDDEDVLALLSPEERDEYLAQDKMELSGTAYDESTSSIPGWYDVENMSSEEREEAGIEDEDFDPTDILDFSEADILAVLSETEKLEYQEEKKDRDQQHNMNRQKPKNPIQRLLETPLDEMDDSTKDNLKRIKARMAQKKTHASFATYSRPSVVNWLKDKKADEGTPIRGGNFWLAAAGAAGVDDSGLVLLCPKSSVENLFVDFAEYVTVVGNGEFLAPNSKTEAKEFPKEAVDLAIVSKVRKGREGDTCQTVQVTISESLSTCSHVVPLAQAQFADGVRGDPAANPFDRRAPRRLIHCNSMSVSSLSFDEDAQVVSRGVPDDIRILSDRLNNHKYSNGSFLGRSALRGNTHTNAYREIDGAADGFPGWTVDRYGEFLFLQHDEKEYKGPLPSIHDGNTKGVYYLPANPDRGAMGSGNSRTRPILLEGSAAPDVLPVIENGVIYHVGFADLSTGIFLDQRPQRAWLTRYCNEDTHVLNCFAHCGAFSVAAAMAGASTVSLDLNKKWLDRVEPQLLANGIAFDERHDCIFGDCFQWLEKLSNRGEKYDIVILDPPSSSVGKKKKRWSVKSDMDELVALAAPLVKKGGLLWTTTNSAGLSPLKFARMCKKGLDSAGLESAKLERIQPMPVDFQSIGPQPVKNLVWRIP